jgi:hypothetical protein
MEDKKAEPAAESGTVERRQHLRVKLTARIAGRPLGVDQSFVVEEASVGGFSIKSPTPFVPDSDYRFRMSNESGQSTIVEALCRYCNPIPTEGDAGSPSYLVGFQFLPQDTKRLRLIWGAIAIDAP